MARKLTDKQKQALAKGRALMKKAVALQKSKGVYTTTIKSGGQPWTIKRYKLPLNKALKQVSK